MIGYGIFDKVDELILELIYVEEKSIEEKVILDTLLNTENFGEWVFNDPSFFGYFERRNALNFYYKWKVMVDRKELKNSAGDVMINIKNNIKFIGISVNNNIETIPVNVKPIERPEDVYYTKSVKCNTHETTEENINSKPDLIKQNIKIDKYGWKKLWQHIWFKYINKNKGR